MNRPTFGLTLRASLLAAKCQRQRRPYRKLFIEIVFVGVNGSFRPVDVDRIPHNCDNCVTKPNFSILTSSDFPNRVNIGYLYEKLANSVIFIM